MALVTISGYPCSGKSRRAAELAKYLESRLSSSTYTGPNLSVVVIDDETNHVSRSVYDDSLSEKPGRANIFAAVIRHLGPDTVVICDSLNYIKGFRYQMYCAAREAHVRPCTIHVATPPDTCREWHEKRGECSYKPATFDNLIMRYEEPSSMVRWDSPLFTIPLDEDLPYDDIWRAITTGEKKPPTAAVVRAPKPPPNTLQVLTNTTSTIVSTLLSHINASPAVSTFIIPSPPAASPGSLILHLPIRRVTLAEMQRVKRQFEGVQTRAQSSNGRAAGTWTEEGVASAFVRFLETAWDTAS